MTAARNIPSPFSRLEKKEQSLVKKINKKTLASRLGLEENSLNLAINQANMYVLNGMLLPAFKIYSSLVLLDPLNIDVQIGLANCATELGEHLTAIQAAAAIIMTAPTDPRGYLLSGKNCLILGKYKEAREDLEDAQRFAADDIGPLGAKITRQAVLLLSRLDTLQADGCTE